VLIFIFYCVSYIPLGTVFIYFILFHLGEFFFVISSVQFFLWYVNNPYNVWAYSSVADPGLVSRIRKFFHPGSFLKTRGVKQCCGSGSGRIRTFLVGCGSGRLDPQHWSNINESFSCIFRSLPIKVPVPVNFHTKFNWYLFL
jgi:hypothetical protein